jgi:FkbM family methyltransferase
MVALARDGCHYAFEPLPDKASALRVAFPAVQVFELALSDSAGVASFQHVITRPAYSGLRRHPYPRPDERIETIMVKTARLDTVLPEDLSIRFIKVDVEGAEMLVFRGARQTLTRCKPFIVFEHGGSAREYGVRPEDVFDLLVEECGLKLSVMARWLRGESDLSRDAFLAAAGAEEYYFLAHP